MSAQKTRLGKYIQFKGSIYQQVVADVQELEVKVEEIPEGDEELFYMLKGGEALGGPAARGLAESVLSDQFKEDPSYAPDDADAYIGKGKDSRWQAFVDEDDTITFEHENGRRFVFTQQR